MEITDITWFGKLWAILIEKCSNAIWLVWEPHQIKRTSKAKAEAEVEWEKIKIIWRLKNIAEISEYEERWILRRIKEGGIQQENIEKILLWAPEFLTENSKPQSLNDDWLRNFSEKAKMTSDNEVQQIWSRILAWESNHPWSFSKRTINAVSIMEKSDAEMFTKLCNFCIWIDSELISVGWVQRSKSFK